MNRFVTRGALALAYGLCAAVVACSVLGDAARGDQDATESEIDRLFDVDDVSILFPFRSAATAPAGSSSATPIGSASLAPRAFDASSPEPSGSSAPPPVDAGSGTPIPAPSSSDFFDAGTPNSFAPPKPTPAIAVSDGDLWSADNFQRVMAHAASLGIFTDPEATAREHWHVVGVRFDPCAPGLSDKAIRDVGVCVPQLRLIAQPLDPFATTIDAATHLVFDLGVETLASAGGDPEQLRARITTNPVVLQAVDKLRAIKRASVRAGATTAGKPLGVHPGLVAAPDEVGKLVRDLVMTLPKQPSAIAFMGLSGPSLPWVFFSGKVSQGTWTPVTAPVFRDTQTAQQNAQTFNPFASGGAVTPAGRPELSTTPLFVTPVPFFDDADAGIASSGDAGGAPTPPPSPPPLDKRLAFDVENPAIAHFFNTDCVSCHTSSSRTHALGIGDGDEIAARPPAPKNVTGYVRKEEAQDSDWNVRNFGYVFSKPSVSGRALTETIDVVVFVNQRIVRAHETGAVPNSPLLAGPGPDCTARETDVWRCFRDGFSDCLARCAPGPRGEDTITPEPPPPPPIPETSPREPCSVAHAGDDASVIVGATPSGVAAALLGNDLMCLSRVMNGAFSGTGTHDEKVRIACSPGGAGGCTIDLDGSDLASAFAAQSRVSVELGPADAPRFARDFFRTGGAFFQNRGGGGDVQIACTPDAGHCTIALAQRPASIAAPDPGARRINPTAP